MVMGIIIIGNVLVDVFELQAAIGLALLAIVIGVLVYGLFSERRYGHTARSHR